ncbi:MAG: hypothetical protein J6C00_13050 [Eubacterium sp.]|nr:hypothetical protein [Eubacterium sp.]
MADLGKIVPTNAGEWDSATSYERLTFVKHNGATYLSTVDSQGQEPSKESECWMFLVEEVKGAAVYIQETAPDDTTGLWVW